MIRAGRGWRIVCAAVSVATLAGCAGVESLPSSDDATTDVVATTPIIADLARHVAGDRARVTSLLPPSADPHTHELTLRDVRNIANSDLAFTNGLLLEPQAVTHSVSSSVRPGVPVVALAEKAESKGAQLRPLVENLSLDSVWLGLRAVGSSPQSTQSGDQVAFQVTDVDGPGAAAAYVTGTFGQPEIFFDSADGLDDKPVGTDSIALPTNAHTHMSWSFSQPGIYRLGISAYSVPASGGAPQRVADTTVTFAVGVAAPTGEGTTILRGGHRDVEVDVGKKNLVIHGEGTHNTPQHTVIEVPTRTLQQIPSDRQFRFLGEPGSETYLLPQAVLGKHVHGELDPHLWHSVHNASAMVEVIRDELVRVDPAGAPDYQRNASAYLDRLNRLDEDMHDGMASIPERARHLVTAHDGYAYLASSYGLDVAGFVTPNPNIEPSARDIIALTRTLENLQVPAVFIEPTLAGQARDLQAIAQRLGVQVCTIRGDTLDDEANGYEALMRTNLREITRCLGGHAT